MIYYTILHYATQYYTIPYASELRLKGLGFRMWGNFGKCGAGAPIYADVCVYVSFNVKHACEVVEVCASSENVYACMYADKNLLS